MAFAEAGSSADSRTAIVDLHGSTILANSRNFNYDISKTPKQAYTMRIATLMETRKLDIYALCPDKAEPALKAITGPVTTNVPASFVQDHQDGNFIIGGASAYLIQHEDILKNSRNTGLNLYYNASNEQVKQAINKVAEMDLIKIENEAEKIQPILEKRLN